MAASTFALQHVAPVFIDAAQRGLTFLVGPLCLFGGTCCLGLVVVDAKLFVGLPMWGGVRYYWFYHNLDLTPHERVDNFYMKMTQALVDDGRLYVFHDPFERLLRHEIVSSGSTPIQPGGEIEIQSIFEDMSKPLAQLWLIFALQSSMCSLALYTSFSIYSDATLKLTSWGFAGIVVEDKASSFTDAGCYIFWVIGFLVQMGAYFQRGGESQLGRTWRIERWLTLANQRSFEVYCPGTDTRPARWRPVSRREIKIRNRLGFVVNTMYRDVIAFITPLVLLKSDSAMDVAQNALALSYITTLDDVSDTRIRFRTGNDHQD